MSEVIRAVLTAWGVGLIVLGVPAVCAVLGDLIQKEGKR